MWGYRQHGRHPAGPACVQRLRSKIEHGALRTPEIVVTVRGVGYAGGQLHQVGWSGPGTCVMSSVRRRAPSARHPPSGGCPGTGDRQHGTARSSSSAASAGSAHQGPGRAAGQAGRCRRAAGAETEVARQALATAPGTDVDVAGQQVALIEPLKERGSANGSRSCSRAIRSSSTLIAGGVCSAAPGSTSRACRCGLQRHFAEAATTRNDTTTAWTYTAITTTSQSGRTTSQPGVVVGAPVQLPMTTGSYTVYFLYPLDEQAETLGLITRAWPRLRSC
ncbi:MAG: hypothetical protein R2734_05330 [Nocardioides sp.]